MLLILNFLQRVYSGSFAELEVLKFDDDNYFSFHWSKVGSRRQIKTTSEPNVLTFQSVNEKDLGYYRCEVKEAGRVVLTVYRALYRDEFNPTNVTPPLPGMHSNAYSILLTSQLSFFVILESRKRPPSLRDVESDAKRPRTKSTSGMADLIFMRFLFHVLLYLATSSIRY